MTEILARVEATLDAYLSAHPRPFPPTTERPYAR
jgi:hypothetical protein